MSPGLGGGASPAATASVQRRSHALMTTWACGQDDIRTRQDGHYLLQIRMPALPNGWTGTHFCRALSPPALYYSWCAGRKTAEMEQGAKAAG